MNSHDSASLEADPFTFQYQVIDDPDDDQRFTRYWDLEPLQRGPQPVPDWLVTDRAAVETDLGILKTGKEADVYLLERAVPVTGESCVLAAKRYRSTDHRNFRRTADYTEGRRTKDSREARAMAKGSAFGKAVAAGQWAGAEWDSLQRLLKLPDATLVFPGHDYNQKTHSTIGEERRTNKRLVAGREKFLELMREPRPTRPALELLSDWFDQLREAMSRLAVLGFAHGDLSPYNILAAGERLVIIDVPQMVDLVANPHGTDILMRDCHNVCSWFVRRGLAVDEDELFGSLLAAAW